MARKRNIHPNFFINEDLGELQPLARLLLIGIWTLADREGRLEDRPKKIRAEVLPYDTVDGEKLLTDIAAKGFIIRYEIDGKKYIQINSWDKYQDIHPKETESKIPPIKQQEQPEIDLGLTQEIPLDNPRDVQGESFNPIPSFPSITSYPSLVPPVVPQGEQPNEKTDDRINYQDVVDEYNDSCPKMPKAIALSKDRKSAIRSRITEYSRQAITDVLRYVSGSPHHNGSNERGWTADFDWIMGPKNFRKLYERAKSGAAPPTGQGRKMTQREIDDIERRRLAEEYDRNTGQQANRSMQSKLPSVLQY